MIEMYLGNDDRAWVNFLREAWQITKKWFECDKSA